VPLASGLRVVTDSAPLWILTELASVLGPEDDRLLWHALVDVLVADLALVTSDYRARESVLLQIGTCSRWLRPHQTRWTAAGGFAWPSGYGDGQGGHSSLALPQLDASMVFHVDSDGGGWRRIEGRPGGRPLVLRVAVPARTARHRSAAIHTIWLPGTPRSPERKRTRFLGFRRERAAWQLVADSAPLWEAPTRAS